MDSWYADLKHLLQTSESPRNLNKNQMRALNLKPTQYQILIVLFQNKYNEVLLRCLEKQYVDHVLKELHDGPT